MGPPRPGRRDGPPGSTGGFPFGLGSIISVLLILGILFFSYFILPKIEANYKDLGRPMPMPLFLLSFCSYWFFRYYGPAVLFLGIAFLAWERLTTPRGPGQARS